jgi:hypothetical protein
LAAVAQGATDVTVDVNSVRLEIANGLDSREAACETAFRHWWNEWESPRRDQVEALYVPDSFTSEIGIQYREGDPVVQPLSDMPYEALAVSRDNYVWRCSEFEPFEDGSQFWGGYTCGVLCGSSCRYVVQENTDGWSVEKIGAICPMS